jgi:hypothetical protein
MSSFVEIRTSVAEIVAIANGLRDKGRDLTDAMSHAVSEVEAHERNPKTFPPDEFTDTFMGIYHKEVPTGDGHTMSVNEAVKHGVGGLGEAMTSLGDFVADAMWTYQGQDTENATDIGGTAPDS